jgi:hypothetical protein
MRLIPAVMLCTIALHADIALAQDADVRSSQDVTVEQQRLDLDSTVIALRAQNEVIQSYGNKMLDVVYWSLGGVVTLTAILVGFSWFANMRLHERDKAALRQELLAAVASEGSRLGEESQKTREALATAQATTLAAIRSELDGLVEDAIGVAQRATSSELSVIRGQIAMLRIEALRTEARDWVQQNILTNAVRTYFEVIDIARPLVGDYFAEHHIAEAIDEMRRHLHGIDDLDASNAVDFLEKADNLPTRFAAEVDPLKAAINKARL